MTYRFQDRTDAGRALAALLTRYQADANAIVLALPRGGVPVGYEVATALGLPLDVLVVRKLGVPSQPELAMGAVASGGAVVLNEEAKGTTIRHMARIPGFGRENLVADGAGQVINAISAVWAPSWRMVVELGPEVRAWGNYPGGQSGNPGSTSYDDRVDDWAAGRPFELLFFKSADETSPRIVGRTVMRGAK